MLTKFNKFSKYTRFNSNRINKAQFLNKTNSTFTINLSKFNLHNFHNNFKLCIANILGINTFMIDNIDDINIINKLLIENEIDDKIIRQKLANDNYKSGDDFKDIIIKYICIFTNVRKTTVLFENHGIYIGASIIIYSILATISTLVIGIDLFFVTVSVISMTLIMSSPLIVTESKYARLARYRKILKTNDWVQKNYCNTQALKK